ncbi:NTF2-like N-terminal transpeptidase domain-containing protein [Streptomyces sp. NPDC048291]|uniref:NTF2-like N-terminal transpeptidase domain-containing protein n=1 Tax=Streptomyces sp. NPDC048291 TaxID=3365530 RepID=UPI0037225515
MSSGTAQSGETKAARGFDPTAVSSEPPSDAKAVTLTRVFLDNWTKQQLGEAASRTDASATAASALRGYADGLHVKSLAFSRVTSAGPSAVTPGATKVTFDVTAQVAGGTWTYASAVAVRQSTNGQLAVHWNNSVLCPGLGDDQSLTAGKLPADATPAKVVASDGRTDLARFSSLHDIVATVRKNATPTGGSPGTGVAVVDASGEGVKALKVFGKGQAPVIRTTIDASLQAVAENAVTDSHLQGKPAGTVADHRRYREAPDPEEIR